MTRCQAGIGAHTVSIGMIAAASIPLPLATRGVLPAERSPYRYSVPARTRPGWRADGRRLDQDTPTSSARFKEEGLNDGSRHRAESRCVQPAWTKGSASQGSPTQSATRTAPHTYPSPHQPSQLATTQGLGAPAHGPFAVSPVYAQYCAPSGMTETTARVACNSLHASESPTAAEL